MFAVGVLATGHTAAAEDALGSVTNDCGGQLIHRNRGLAADVSTLTGTGNRSHVQQFALSVLIALLTVNVMVGQQQFHRSPAGLGGLGTGDNDLHAFVDRINTGGNQTSCTLHFHQADTAGTVAALTVVECTETGNLIAAGLGGFQNGQAFCNLIGNAFNLNIHHFSRVLLTSSQWPSAYR